MSRTGVKVTGGSPLQQVNPQVGVGRQERQVEKCDVVVMWEMLLPPQFFEPTSTKVESMDIIYTRKQRMAECNNGERNDLDARMAENERHQRFFRQFVSNDVEGRASMAIAARRIDAMMEVCGHLNLQNHAVASNQFWDNMTGHMSINMDAYRAAYEKDSTDRAVWLSDLTCIIKVAASDMLIQRGFRIAWRQKDGFLDMLLWRRRGVLAQDTSIMGIAYLFPKGTPVVATQGRSNTEAWSWQIQTEGLQLTELAKSDMVHRFPTVSSGAIIEDTRQVVE